MKYCSDQVRSNSATLNHVQLCRLSLTRIGFTERMLWVQMLDLSHNKLRSIEGQILKSYNSGLYFRGIFYTYQFSVTMAPGKQTQFTVALS